MKQPKQTRISWTHFSWNPVHGCSKISPGCDNCYAETISHRWKITTKPWSGKNAKENVLLKPHRLNEPYNIKLPSMVFVNSMSDIFHPLVPDDYISKIFEVMKNCPQHTFQVLTKRAPRAAKWKGEWRKNIWQGVSIENKEQLHRIDQLKRCAAKTKFLSLEPLLEDLGTLNLEGIHWIIVGGESGSNHRPMPHEWARNIRDQCVEQNIPFFFKQSSAYKNETGTLLEETDGSKTEWHQFPGDIT